MAVDENKERECRHGHVCRVLVDPCSNVAWGNGSSNVLRIISHVGAEETQRAVFGRLRGWWDLGRWLWHYDLGALGHEQVHRTVQSGTYMVPLCLNIMALGVHRHRGLCWSLCHGGVGVMTLATPRGA